MSATASLTDETITVWRDEINQQLAMAIAERADCPQRLRDAMAYSLLAGGKRLRPLLTLMACDACGEEISKAMPAALAVEMVHTYSLIHDDLPAMDDDELRRGRPTCHVQFDEATAILAGDGLLTLAFGTLATQVQPPEIAAACCADLAGAAGWEGMVGGQMADLEGGSAKWEVGNAEMSAFSIPHSELESIHRRKTGRLLASAVTMGGRIAGANPQTLRSLRTYGEAIGLAFQIADDLLDVSGDAETMGKETHKDEDAGKLTYPALLGQEESRRRAQQLIDDACEAVSHLGERSRRLEAVAHYIIERDR